MWKDAKSMSHTSLNLVILTVSHRLSHSSTQQPIASPFFVSFLHERTNRFPGSGREAPGSGDIKRTARTLLDS